MRALLDRLLTLLRGPGAAPPGVAGPLVRDRRPAPERGPSSPTTTAGAQRTGGARTAYPGDFAGMPEVSYAPDLDGDPDPGEIVWTWVPFEEDHAKGKDRPVLLIGHDREWLLGLQLTSKDHDRDAEQERRAGRLWVDIGTGSWDRAGRPSEVRVNRILRVDATLVRREGAVLERVRFDQVIAAVRAART